MKQYYPMMIDLTGHLCLVVGGGTVAERKVAALMKAGALVRIASPTLTDLLQGWVRSYRDLEWRKRDYQAADGEGCLLVVAATDHKQVNQKVFADAQSRGQWINVVDQPDLCNFTVPSVVQRGKLQIAISTGGASPALAKQIRKQLEGAYGNEYEHLLSIMEELRVDLKREIPDPRMRHELLKQLISDKWLEVCRKEPDTAKERMWQWIEQQMSPRGWRERCYE